MFTVSINVSFGILGRKRFFTHWLDSGFQTSKEILTWWKTLSHQTTEWRQKTQQRRRQRVNPDLIWCSGFSWRKWKHKHKHRCRVNGQCCCYVKKTLNCSSSKHSGWRCQQFSPDVKSKHTSAQQMFPPSHIHVNWSSTTDEYKNAFPVSMQRDLKWKQRSSRHWLSLWDRLWWEMMEKHWNPTCLWRNAWEKVHLNKHSLASNMTRWRNVEPSLFQYDVWLLSSFHIHINMLFNMCWYEIYFNRL